MPIGGYGIAVIRSCALICLPLALVGCQRDPEPSKPATREVVRVKVPIETKKDAGAAVTPPDAGQQWKAPELTAAAKTKGKATDSRIRTLGTGVIFRDSETRLPPWKSVTVTNVFGFKKEPKIGAKVTILPSQVDGAPFELRVTTTKKRDEDTPVWWEVELEPIGERAYFDAIQPKGYGAAFLGRVAVLDPAIPTARLLEPTSIGAKDLPAKLDAVVIVLAVDSTGDRLPDGIEASFCCEDESKPADTASCDYTCSRTFIRRAGKWVQVEYSQPQ